MKLVRVNVDYMQAFVMIDSVQIVVNGDVNVKNWLIKASMMMDLSGILARLSVNVINHVMLGNIWIMHISNAERG